MDEAPLERLIIDNPAFDQLNAAMDVFCPFDAVGMNRQEVRHGFFLQYVLDPARPHGFGAECLRAFMRVVAGTLSGAGLPIAPLDVHLMNLDGAIVRREYHAIDLLIEIPQERLVIAIELKIDATEHSGQLGRYRRIVERDWPDSRQLLLFLTKRGDGPSSGDGAGWHGLALTPVVDAFADVAKRQVGEAAARMMLSAYVAMLRRDHVMDDRLEQLASGLWREHRDALEFLMSRRPDGKYAVLSSVLSQQEDVARRVSDATGLSIKVDHSTRSVVRFAIADWDDLAIARSAEGWTASNRALLIELKESAGAVRVQLVLGPGPRRQAIFDALRAGGADIGGGHGIGEKWRQLANTGFSPDPRDGTDEVIDRLVDHISTFVGQHERTYRDALTVA